MREQPFQRKTYGRIFVAQDEQIELVEKIIGELDPFEAKYMPEVLVTIYSPGGKNPLIYLHKFEMDIIALTRTCLEKGIWIWCVDCGQEGDRV